MRLTDPRGAPGATDSAGLAPAPRAPPGFQSPPLPPAPGPTGVWAWEMPGGDQAELEAGTQKPAPPAPRKASRMLRSPLPQPQSRP